MSEKLAARRLNKLTHPFFILALAMILLNAMILQAYAPSWLTGKLADLAWMVVLPVAAATLLGLIWQGSEKLTFWIPTVIIALCYALCKTIPPANTFLREVFLILFNIPLKFRLDPSDILALAGVFGAAWIWGQSSHITRRIWRFAPLFLLMLAGIADAVDPGYDQIDCLVVDEEAMIAFTPDRSVSYFGDASQRKAYLSWDNGRTWEDIGVFSPDEEGDAGMAEGIEVAALIGECRPWNQQLMVDDPQNPQVQYMIISDQGVYRSWDGGESLHKEFSVPEGVTFKDVAFAPDGRTLVVAADYHGVLLRQEDGTYLWADPSGMSLSPGD